MNLFEIEKDNAILDLGDCLSSKEVETKGETYSIASSKRVVKVKVLSMSVRERLTRYDHVYVPTIHKVFTRLCDRLGISVAEMARQAGITGALTYSPSFRKGFVSYGTWLGIYQVAREHKTLFKKELYTSFLVLMAPVRGTKYRKVRYRKLKDSEKLSYNPDASYLEKRSKRKNAKFSSEQGVFEYVTTECGIAVKADIEKGTLTHNLDGQTRRSDIGEAKETLSAVAVHNSTTRGIMFALNGGISFVPKSASSMHDGSDIKGPTGIDDEDVSAVHG